MHLIHLLCNHPRNVGAPNLNDILQGFIKTMIVSVELYIVQAYYNQQKLYAISNFVRLKWKYLPKTKAQTDKTIIISTTENYDCTQQDDLGHIPTIRHL